MVTLAGVVGEYPGTWLEMVFGVVSMREEHYALGADMSRAAGRPLNWNAIQINTGKLELVEDSLRASDYAQARGATVYALIPATPMVTLLNFVNCFLIDTIPGWSDLVPLSLAERREALAVPRFAAI